MQSFTLISLQLSLHKYPFQKQKLLTFNIATMAERLMNERPGSSDSFQTEAARQDHLLCF